MIVGALVIVWVLVLSLTPPGPASFETLKKTLGEVSERLATIEDDYQRLAQRVGGQR
jgi:hypothetical protein